MLQHIRTSCTSHLFLLIFRVEHGTALIFTMATMVKRKREDVQKRKRGDSQNGIQSGSLTSQESLGGKRHLTQSKRKECLPSKKNTQPLAIRPHGKDAKLVLQVAETSTEPRPSREMAFDAKSIGKKAVFRPILTTPFKADWYVLFTRRRMLTVFLQAGNSRRRRTDYFPLPV